MEALLGGGCLTPSAPIVAPPLLESNPRLELTVVSALAQAHTNTITK